LFFSDGSGVLGVLGVKVGCSKVGLFGLLGRTPLLQNGLTLEMFNPQGSRFNPQYVIILNMQQQQIQYHIIIIFLKK
jgi:hypothetical protein